jgi:dTDP-4-amino-4,6-dideoxygalactose transaminase
MQDINLPIAKRMSREVLSLPMCPHLSLAMVEEIAQHVKRILESRGV